MRAYLASRKGEVCPTREIVKGVGLDPDDALESNKVQACLGRMCESGEAVRLRKGLYRAPDMPTRKEERALEARRLPTFHGIILGARVGVDLSSVEAAQGYFRERGGSLATRAPSAVGIDGGNKVVWESTMPVSGRTLRVATSARGMEVSFGCTDAPLSPGEVLYLADHLAMLTGLGVDEWTFSSLGINADHDNFRLDGFRSMEWTLERFNDELLRIYPHKGRGVRREVHTKTPLPLRALMEWVQGVPVSFEGEAHLAAVREEVAALREEMMRTRAAHERHALLLEKREERERAEAAKRDARRDARKKVVRSPSGAASDGIRSPVRPLSEDGRAMPYVDASARRRMEQE